VFHGAGAAEECYWGRAISVRAIFVERLAGTACSRTSATAEVDFGRARMNNGDTLLQGDDRHSG
jgi:hypothetical protein